MQTLLLIGHLILALAIIGVVLLQRSAGGALGIGGGGDGLQSGRAPSNPLVKLTTILGICFFISSLGLTLLAQRSSSILDEEAAPSAPISIPTPAEQGDRR